jgi:hypothetical protein
MDADDAKHRLAWRLLWFVVLWLAGVAAVAAVTFFLRALLM